VVFVAGGGIGRILTDGDLTQRRRLNLDGLDETNDSTFACLDCAQADLETGNLDLLDGNVDTGIGTVDGVLNMKKL
jgi:hypothetical protein